MWFSVVVPVVVAVNVYFELIQGLVVGKVNFDMDGISHEFTGVNFVIGELDAGRQIIDAASKKANTE